MAHPPGSLPTTPRPRMTFEDFLVSPYERAEWVDGEVFELSPENVEHTGIVGFLYRLLSEFVEHHDLGRVLLGFLMKTGARLPGRVPDVMFVARAHEGRVLRSHLDGPADLAVEVVSPDSAVRDRQAKRREYEEGGVREYWLVDSIEGRALFLALEDGRYRPLPLGADGTVRSRVLPGFWLKPEWLLVEPRPRLVDVLQAWGLVSRR